MATLALAMSFPMAAQAVEPETTLAFNLGAISDYRVRGIAQTAKKPALQGGVDLAFKSGAYLGAAFSNVNWVKEFNGATQGSYEIDLFGGYKAQITDTSFSYDVGLITYRYPGNNSGAANAQLPGSFSNASTSELYGALSYSIYTLKYNRSLGDFLGNLNSTGSQYIDFSAAISLGDGYTLIPHIGRQVIPNQSLNLNYSDVALTLSKDFGNGLVGTVAALATDAKKFPYTDLNGKYLANSTVVIGLKYSF